MSQNLLLQPATPSEVADGHPLGIPILKVADFGFARILPAAAMAETLCGSPLYMAPEILRYEKYDAKADLWSVGAVLFEMSVGRSPFRAPNHVELLRRIEKGGDRIKFPDESSRAPTPGDGDAAPPIPVSADIKALIRGLLKQRPAERMNFEEFFAAGSAVWEGYMTESVGDVTTSIDVSTDSSALGPSAGDLQQKNDSTESFGTAPLASPSPSSPVHAAVKRAMSGDFSRTSTSAPTPVPTPGRQTSHRSSEPKYYVGDEPAETTTSPTNSAPTSPTALASGGGAGPQPIGTSTVVRSRTTSRTTERGPSSHSIEDPPVVTPTGPVPRPSIGGSPLAATPPITMTGIDENALGNSDSVGREYVVVEKRTVEINELADELEQTARRPASGAVVRRPSSRSVSSRQPSFKPGSSSPSATGPLGYSPPFAMGMTPPFAVPPAKQTVVQRPRQPSLPSPTVFPPPGAYAMSPDRRPSLPSSHALARVLTNTAVRLLNTSASTAATAIARATGTATYKRWPQVERSGELDPAEGVLLDYLEDTAHKAYVLFDLADSRIVQWSQSSRMPSVQSQTPSATITQHNSPPSNAPPFAVPPVSRRKSSASSTTGDVLALRQQEEAAGDACALYFKSLAFICAGHERFKRYWDLRERRGNNHQISAELNERGCSNKKQADM